MKKNKRKRNLTTELFLIYFWGYIGVTLIILVSAFFSYKIYTFISSEKYYNNVYFKKLGSQISSDCNSITDDDLEKIKGFLIKIDSKNNVVYKRGNVLSDFDKISLDNYMRILGLKDKNDISIKVNVDINEELNNVSSVLYESDDKRIYSIYSKYIESKEQLVVLGCPYEEIVKNNYITKIMPNRYLVRGITVLNVLMILSIVYVLTEITSRNFIHPIMELLMGVNQISCGKYDVRIENEKIREFDELSNGFNFMAKTIQDEKKERKRQQKLREDLVLDISHDLKNPLSSILGYSETLIKDNSLSESDKLEYLRIINQNSYRANKLINDLFEFSLYDNCDYKLNKAEVDINEFLRRIIAGYISEFDHNKLNYDFQISDEIKYVMADKEKLARAINNILDNKIKYNSEGNTVFVNTKCKNGKIYILFGDDGEKIPDELKKTIFNPFERVDKSRNSKTGGTGLGLSITKKIINKHNGEIQIKESKKGTVFEITLPCV